MAPGPRTSPTSAVGTEPVHKTAAIRVGPIAQSVLIRNLTTGADRTSPTAVCCKKPHRPPPPTPPPPHLWPPWSKPVLPSLKKIKK